MVRITGLRSRRPTQGRRSTGQSSGRPSASVTAAILVWALSLASFAEAMPVRPGMSGNVNATQIPSEKRLPSEKQRPGKKQGPTKKELAAWVDGFCDPSSADSSADSDADSDDETNEWLNRLRNVPPARLTSLVERKIKSKKTRDRALKLAVTLRVPGLFKRVKSLFKTDPKVVAEIAFQSGDKGSEKFLSEAWLDAKAEDSTFEILRSGFQRHFVSAKTVQALHKGATDKKASPEHREAIAAILVFQFGADDALADEILANFKLHFAKFHRKAQPFPVAGEELLSRPEWVAGFGAALEEDEDETGDDEGEDGEPTPASGSTLRFPPDQAATFREKIIVKPRGSLRLPGITEKNCTVTFRIMVLDGEGCGLGVLMKGNSMVGPRSVAGEWQMQESIRTGTAPVKPGEWHELRCSLKGSNLSVTLDGKPLAATNLYGDTINGLMLTGGNASLLVGSVELRRGR